MNQKDWGKPTLIHNKLLTEIEETGNISGFEEVYEREQKVLHYVYELNEEAAKKEVQALVELLKHSFEKNLLKEFRCYFISLSSSVARNLASKHLTANQAFIFSNMCCKLVEEKLTSENASLIGSELVSFYMYVLTNRHTPVFMHETVNKVIEYIDENVDSSISVEEIAHQFDVSTSHLSRIFRQHVGVTLVEYINIRKVEEAQYYLRFSPKKISDISDQFYFCNQSYFTRIFKKYTGETPRRFRNDLAGDYFHYSFEKVEMS